MTTFCERFSSYYDITTESYVAWEQTYQPPEEGDLERRRVCVETLAQEHPVPQAVKERLDRIMTPEIYGAIVAGDFRPEFYEERGFTVLKARNTLVLEHAECPGCLIKTAIQARRFKRPIDSRQTGRHPVAYTNLLRPAGRAYYAEHNTDPLFTFPEEYLYEYEASETESEREALPHHRYFSVCRKVEVLSASQSLSITSSLSTEKQIEVAHRVCNFVQATGFTDLHPGNLLYERDPYSAGYRFSIIDTEPLWFLIEASDEEGEASLLSDSSRKLLGLLTFRDRYCREYGFTEMAQVVDSRIAQFVAENRADLHPREENGGYMQAGLLHQKTHWTWKTVALILLTIPFFWIILPLFALRAACSESAYSSPAAVSTLG